MKTIHPFTGSRQRQSGITLVIMLVMLVIISLTSVAVIRGSLSADRVSNNLRVQTNATQAAQIGLRYCETEAVKDAAVSAITVQDGSTPKWEIFANWKGDEATAMAKTVPAAFYGSTPNVPIPAKRPQCIAEKVTFGTPTDFREVITVTARGFSGDYNEDDDGRATQGSVVWLQSQISLKEIEVEDTEGSNPGGSSSTGQNAAPVTSGPP